MYNPINNCTQDEGRLQEKDQRERNKKQRYKVRYEAEVNTRNEVLAEKQRLDDMSLRKVSNQRVAEELSRGFDILTNGELRGGLAQMHQTGFMQTKPRVWDKIETERTFTEASAASSRQMQQDCKQSDELPMIDFKATSNNFQRRSRRLNTNISRNTPDVRTSQQLPPKPEPLVGLQKVASSNQIVEPSSVRISQQQNQLKPSSRASQQQPPSSRASQLPPKSSRRSALVSQSSAGSKPIRTGGFQKLGEAIVH